MAKTVKFKNPDSRMVVPGFGQIDSSNLTYEKYLHLLKLSPAHEDQFIVSEEGEKEIKSPKPKKDESSIQA